MMMPNRSYSAANGYRYGFNGQEKDNEIKGEGNSYGAEYWEYDSRLGRRWNVDPSPNPSISVYNCFAGNPIWHSDVLGDSIAPNRTIAYNVFVVTKTRDFATTQDYKRYKLTQEKNPANTILIETDKLDESTAKEITKKLGNNGYIGTLAIDFHRSTYDKMEATNKDKFYSTLANGYTGDKTSVLLGMCWSGGGPTYKDKTLPDLTLGISQKLDKATVYGLRTEAASLSFNKTGDYGTFNPAYAFDNGVFGKNERANVSTWTISTYNPTLKRYTSQKAHEMINLNLKSQIIRTPIKEPKDPAQGTVKYEYGRIM